MGRISTDGEGRCGSRQIKGCGGRPKDITEVLNNASDYDPKDVKFNKQGYDKFDGTFNAVTMLAEERNNYWD